MPLLEEKVYTIDDIYALPEGERAELIDGHIYYMAPPNRTHQKISMELSARILEYIRSHKGKCEVYAAPFAVYLDDKQLQHRKRPVMAPGEMEQVVLQKKQLIETDNPCTITIKIEEA